VDVCGQDGDEEKYQRDARGGPCCGDHKTNRAGQFAKSGKENHCSRPWDPSRCHANEVFLHGREMCTRREKKHDREAITHIRGPGSESWCARQAERAKNKDRDGKND
jgi:hypothetical protein